MKVFLNGGGDGVKTVEALKKFNGVIDHSKPVLYIPLAMESERYDDCYSWILSELKEVNVPYIDMVRSSDELVLKNLNNYCALFIGDGNTFKLLYELKKSGAFKMISDYLDHDGIVFGGSAGAIIFGYGLWSCMLDDFNEVSLSDLKGFDVLKGISFLCHYTNRSSAHDEKNKKFLLESTKGTKVIALPEEDTLFIDDGKFSVIGDKPFYMFEDGNVIELNGYIDRKSIFLNVDSPQELMDFMNHNITYGWVDYNGFSHLNSMKNIREKYRISSLSEMLITGFGTCVEQAKMIKFCLDRLGYKTKVFCHRGYESEDNFGREIRMHCLVFFYDNGKWYHFEHANMPKRGIHEYDTLEQALVSVTSEFDENDIREITEIPYIPDSLSFKEFNLFVNSFSDESLKKLC